jgi:hypothetical protein
LPQAGAGDLFNQVSDWLDATADGPRLQLTS